MVSQLTLPWPDNTPFPLEMPIGKRVALIAQSDVERFMTMTEQDGGCLRFTRYLDKKTGYGLFGLKCQVTVLAHRFAYTVWRGPVPARWTVDHLCHNEAALAGLCPGGQCAHRACVWPWTLWPATLLMNQKRSPHRPAGGGENHRNARKTHCDNGHEFTPENTYEWRGQRHCRACRAKAAHDFREKGGKP